MKKINRDFLNTAEYPNNFRQTTIDFDARVNIIVIRNYKEEKIMRKMKIGIVIIGDRYSFSEEERKIENVDLNKADAINRAVDGELISSLSERIRALIPQEIETFTAHVIT